MALKRIVLRDFVIVQQLDLDFGSGFTALTGETGAGKSILIDALQLALGARADAGLVREGTQRTEISAEFDDIAGLQPWLEQSGFDTGDSLLLRRTVDVQGKSRGWINGSPATAAQLRAAGDYLLDIHGQHAWQRLMRADAVRSLLDAYAGVSSEKVGECWMRWRSAQKALTEAQNAQNSLQAERERLLWQVAEVEKLAPLDDEWNELNTHHTRLANGQSLLDAAQNALSELDGETGSAISHLVRAHHFLSDLQHLEPEFAVVADSLMSCMAQASDAARTLQSYLRRTELDPEKLQEMDSRMSMWLSLARRYKRMPAELPLLLKSWKDMLQKLDASTDLVALEAAERAHQKSYQDAARQLSQARMQAAPRLSRTVTQAMQELGMAGGQFEVVLQRAAEPTGHGLDEVIFLVAGHAGITPRPIAKAASGGELSRISLAIAVATSALGSAATLIFDEVDAGIGGAVAQTVGRLMQQLGQDRQVLAVTHLPQVAACADQHLLVSKNASPQGPSSTVASLSQDQRAAEVARMLGGEKVSPTSLAHAREMLASAPITAISEK